MIHDISYLILNHKSFDVYLNIYKFIIDHKYWYVLSIFYFSYVNKCDSCAMLGLLDLVLVAYFGLV